MRPEQLLERIERGGVRNISFVDFVRLLEALGFGMERIQGSHHVFVHPRVPRSFPVQPQRGEAKAYQARQLLRLVEDYNLRLEIR